VYNANVKLQNNGIDKWYYVSMPLCEELDKLFKRNPEHLVNVTIEKAVSPGTDSQNSAMHALLQELWQFTMKHTNNPIMDFNAFREYMKLQFNFVYYFMAKGKDMAVPMRWSKMTKDQRCEFMEKLLAYINELDGCNQFGKIPMIIEGMQANSDLMK
jgi:hypothetical protein